ncbi:hypothetical protein D3C85_1273790 [compost metagenome]
MLDAVDLSLTSLLNHGQALLDDLLQLGRHTQVDLTQVSDMEDQQLMVLYWQGLHHLCRHLLWQEGKEGRL